MTEPSPSTPPAPDASTRDRVREWRERDPDATAAEMARGLGVSRRRVSELLRALGLPTRTVRSGRGPQRPQSAFVDRALARAAGQKGGLAKARRRRDGRGPAVPYQGTILDAMDAAGLTGPSFDRWRTFWRAVFALPMDDTDRATLNEFTQRPAPPGPVEEAWMVMGRRGGKSLNAALCAAYLACRRFYAPLMRLDERAVIPVIAADKRQAGQVLGFLKGIARTPTFAPYVARVLKQSVQFHTDVVVEVHAGSYRGTRGYTVVAIVADEVAFWRSDESAEPDKEVFDALRGGMLTIPEALLLGLSTPYARRGELYEAYRQHYGQDSPDVLVWNAATRSMHPTSSRQFIVRRWEKDAAVAASEFGPPDGGQVVFRRDVEAFLDPEVVRAVMVAGRHELPPVPGIVYVAFVDVSGGSRDSFVLAIGHREGERVILDCVREWRAPFDPKLPVKESAELCEKYGIGYVVGDHYAGEWPRSLFADHGIGYELSERVKSDIYRELLPLINGGQAELLDLPRLFTQLIALDRRTSRGGRDTIDFMRRHSQAADGHYPTHDDVANAVAGALVLAAEGGSSEPHNPDDDKPFDPFSPEGLAAERDAQRKSRPHSSFDPKRKIRNAEFGVT